MRAVNDERFDGNELSGLARPGDGGAGLCVIAEINWLSGRTQGCTDMSPVRYGRHLWVRVEKPLQSHSSSAFGSISCLCTDQTAPPFHSFKYSLSAPFP